MRMSDWISDVCSSDLGYASESPEAREGTLEPLFKTIVSHVPTPGLPEDGPFTFLATLLDRDNFIGRILTGRVQSGTIKVNQPKIGRASCRERVCKYV